MKKQPKISEILHLAADKYLWDGVSDDYSTEEYTCHAVKEAITDLWAWGVELAVFEGLMRMGVNPHSCYEFAEYAPGPNRQKARYNWLKFAAMIAEEQGV
jgi:hypothetical protein